MSGTTLATGFCQACGMPVEPIGVEYVITDRHHHDGISEWRCPRCGRREGRWTGRVLRDGDREPRYGRK